MFAQQEIKKVNAIYKCPQCNKHIVVSLMYLPTKWKRDHPETKTCHRCQFCDAKNIINYRVFRKRDGSPRLKIYELTSDNEKCKKYFKHLQWIGENHERKAFQL